MLEVVKRRLAERQCLEECPQLLSEVAALAGGYGPMLLGANNRGKYVPRFAGPPPPPPGGECQPCAQFSKCRLLV